MYLKGIKASVPVLLAYLSVSFTFGIAAVDAGLTWWQALLISLTNLTSSGQFAGVTIMAAGGPYLEMFLTELVINSRYALMGISLSQKLDSKFSTPFRILLGHLNTDEIFAISMSRDRAVSRMYFFGLGTLPYIGWSLGTLAGAILGNILPATVTTALSIAIYAMFIGIIMPAMKSDTHILKVVFIAIAISCCLYFIPLFDFISSGFAIIISCITASVIGALLFPREDDVDDIIDDNKPSSFSPSEEVH